MAMIVGRDGHLHLIEVLMFVAIWGRSQPGLWYTHDMFSFMSFLNSFISSEKSSGYNYCILLTFGWESPMVLTRVRQGELFCHRTHIHMHWSPRRNGLDWGEAALVLSQVGVLWVLVPWLARWPGRLLFFPQTVYCWGSILGKNRAGHTDWPRP